MGIIYRGKTKDLMEDDQGQTYFFFKDDMTGKDGEFDPGANEVGLTVEGSGKANVSCSKFFFEKIAEHGIPTHYISADIDNRTMKVKRAEVFGKGLEVICRYKAVGSFIRRYGLYAEEGMDLDGYVEFTLKDDGRGDPLITKEGLEVLDILKPGEYEEMAKLTRQISDIIREELAKVDLELYDIKLEFGRLEGSDEIVLIDEVSGGNMRVYKGDEYIHPLDLINYL